MREPAAPPVSVHDLPPDRVTEAIGVLSRGMRDNPLHVAAFGADPERWRRSLQRVFAAFFRVMTAQAPLCAVDGETIVGVTGVAPPGTCQPTGTQRLRMAPAVLAHPYAPDHHMVLTGERFGSPLPWPPDVYQVTGAVMLPPTMTICGPITWVRSPSKDSLRLSREIDVFGALRTVLSR